jgi:hypothetical protein
LDDPLAPIKPDGTDPSIHALVGAATRLLKLGSVRDRKFADLIKHHNNLTNSLRELRNEAGPVSHGKDGFLAKLSEHHRRVAVLSADAIIALLHTAYLEIEPDPVRTREPYERFSVTNDKIDQFCSARAEVDEDGVLNVTVILPGGDDLPLRIELSRLIFHADREAYKQAALAVQGITPTDLEPLP